MRQRRKESEERGRGSPEASSEKHGKVVLGQDERLGVRRGEE
jgi:hypothetical protein